MEHVHGKVAVITGGASGIGRAIAHQAGERGMKLVLGDIEEAVLDTTTAALRDRGFEVIGVPTDVSQLESVEALRDAALDAYGAVHLLCNNAGVSGGGRTWEVPIETWRWVLDVDLWSVIYGVRTFVPVLLEQGEGHVVNTASIAGLAPMAWLGPYNVAKSGVVALSETMAQELAGSGVGVSVLCPGFVRTRIHESERNAPPEIVELHEQQPVNGEVRELVRGLIEGGLDPAEVAEQVLDAVQQDHLYVLTHPDSRGWVQARIDRVLSE